MTTEEFVKQNRTGDIRKLAFLASKYPEVDSVYALDQISGWQTARTKLPVWASAEGIVYPPHLSMEQCSSEATASYKSRLALRLVASLSADSSSCRFVDITGGFGVDFSFISSALQIPSVYVERNEKLCSLARHNFPLLGLPFAEVVCGDGTDYALSMPHATMVYIDPARRDGHGARTYCIEDCTPNILELLPMLMEKTDIVMVKLSPMLDWHSAVSDIDSKLCGSKVSEVHIVSTGNECKELLLVISHAVAPLSVVCANDSQTFVFRPSEQVSQASCFPSGELVGSFLYEPNASLMKAGCFNAMASYYGIKVMAPNSHLFVSREGIEDFPGRRFVVDKVSSMNKKEIKAMLNGMDKANSAVRNFPMSVIDVRRKLNLKDGGDIYLFATTSSADEHLILQCHKA